MASLFFDDNDRFVLTDGSISPSALRNIQQLIIAREGISVDTDDLYYEIATSQAKPAKAISKYIKQEHGVTLNNDLRTSIGNLAAKTIQTPVTFLVTFGCEGRSDEYFHRHSCYWGDFSESRDWLEGNGGGAVRAYNAVGDLIGRTWFFPYHGTLLHNGIVLFNAYGRDDLQHVDTWGQGLADAAGVDCCPVNIKDRITSEHGFYWNSRRGVFVGTVKRLPNTSYNVTLDLQPPKAWKYSGTECQCCHQMVSRDEWGWVVIDPQTWHEGKACKACMTTKFSKVTKGEAKYHRLPNTDVVRDENGEVWELGDPGLVYCDTTQQYIGYANATEDELGVIHHRRDIGLTFQLCVGCGHAFSMAGYPEHKANCPNPLHGNKGDKRATLLDETRLNQLGTLLLRAHSRTFDSLSLWDDYPPNIFDE